MGVFDNLNRQIGNDPDDDDTGLNPADIANLPSPQKEIMRLILSEIEMSLDDLIYEFEDNIPTNELIALLDGLAADQWLIKYGEDHIVYVFVIIAKHSKWPRKSLILKGWIAELGVPQQVVIVILLVIVID